MVNEGTIGGAKGGGPLISVVIPAHNEEQLLPRCLASVTRAATHPALAGERVQVTVVLDACGDASAQAIAHCDVTSLAIDARNVGRARAVGAQAALAAGARWLAFTDADSLVPHDWLASQIAEGVEVVCGTVCVESWRHHTRECRMAYQAHYQARDGHRHVHGANLGMSALAYRQAGGFQPVACGEVVGLVQRLLGLGVSIAWPAQPVVITSARRDARVRGGFGDFLVSLECQVMAPRQPRFLTPVEAVAQERLLG